MANKTAVFAGGCFWGMEELFREQNGVVDTEVGYSGGENNNPTYKNHPGHAEALKITYDDTKTSYRKLLDYFFRIHDPTTKNRQGNDIGTSYRSVIFFENDRQLNDAKDFIKMTNESGLYKDPVITNLEPLEVFWSAEEYHQDYLQKNPGGYTCHFERINKPIEN
jgi:peptide-methionine (S)-S-oxide reductase